MNLKACLMLLSIATVTVLFCPTSVLGGTGSPIVSQTSTNPVTVDGSWTTAQEWQDAAAIDCGGYGWIAVKDDSNFLYVLVDFVKDPSAVTGDFAWVTWDQKNDDGLKPNTDDYNLLVSYKSAGSYDVTLQRGTGTGWGTSVPAPSQDISAASSTDAANDAYSHSSHVIYEFRISRKIVDNSTVVTEVGLYAGAFDKTTAFAISFPRNGDYRSPHTWGLLSFSIPVPELPESYVILATLLAASLFVLRRQTSRPRTQVP